MTANDNAPPDPCLVTATENIVNDPFVEGIQKRGKPEDVVITAEDNAVPMTAVDNAASNHCLVTVIRYDNEVFLLDRFYDGSISDGVKSLFFEPPLLPNVLLH